MLTAYIIDCSFFHYPVIAFVCSLCLNNLFSHKNCPKLTTYKHIWYIHFTYFPPQFREYKANRDRKIEKEKDEPLIYKCLTREDRGDEGCKEEAGDRKKNK